MLETSWIATLLIFFMTYVCSWFLFAAMWHFLNLLDGSCVAAMKTFNGAVEFSIETQQAIGYGDKFIRENCLGGTVILVLQELIGRLCDCFWIGLIFLKMSRPKKRSATLQFSKKACITVDKDDRSKTQLVFRIGDTTEALNTSPWVNTVFRLYMFSSEISSAGTHRPFKQQKLELEDPSPLMILPCELCHNIDESSPLFGKNEEDLVNQKVELILVFESVIQSSGNSVHSRTSYSPKDFSWGRMFSEMCFRDDLKNCPAIDWSLFDSTIPCSSFNDRTEYDGSRLGHRRSSVDSEMRTPSPNRSFDLQRTLSTSIGEQELAQRQNFKDFAVTKDPSHQRKLLKRRNDSHQIYADAGLSSEADDEDLSKA